MTFAEVVKGAGTTRIREEQLSMIDALEKVVATMGDNPLLQDHKAKLEEDISRMKKRTTDNRSLAKQIVTLEGWTEREEKRISKIEEELEESRKALVLRKADYHLELAKVTSLKEALQKEETKNTAAQSESELRMEVDAEAETQKLMATELELRRQMASKKDEKGVTIAAKRLKEIEKEADKLHDRLVKRRRQADVPADAATGVPSA
jgi:chromosome segregation ATPase